MYRIMEERPSGETVLVGQATSLQSAKRTVARLARGSRSGFAVVNAQNAHVVFRTQGSRARF